MSRQYVLPLFDEKSSFMGVWCAMEKFGKFLSETGEFRRMTLLYHLAQRGATPKQPQPTLVQGELLEIAASVKRELLKIRAFNSGSDVSARIAEAKRVLETCRSREEVIAGLNKIGRSGWCVAPLVDAAAKQLEQDTSLDWMGEFMVAALTGFLLTLRLGDIDAARS